ncbi:MAG: phosphate acetyltransferase [Lachnospiraceae bacterium]|nr:phosphate acetyltransferase [Lachnospiraceae bacterium]
MDFIGGLKAKAKISKKTIVLPESYERRNLDAAATAIKEGIADIILIGKKDEIIKAAGSNCDVSKAIFIDPDNFEKMEEAIDTLVELRKSKGLTREDAKKLLADPLYFGVMLVKIGFADGMVSGAIHSTADTLRPALQILKTAPGTELVSAFFIMEVQDKSYGENGIILFADCALNQNPNPEELAAIAVSSARSFKSLVGAEPKVALLSHSTRGSSKHPDVDKVATATKLAKEKAPDLMIDGELQLDAAVVPSVGSQKAPDSKVAGKANVVVFPDLDAGNIGYKLVQRLGNAMAYGPVLQGIAMPINDLSRGCSAEDIVGVITITAIQAQM